jgi:hypothetical protein
LRLLASSYNMSWLQSAINGKQMKKAVPRKKTYAISIRVDEVLKQAIEKAAHDDTRSITSYVERIIVENLRTKGYLKK